MTNRDPGDRGEPNKTERLWLPGFSAGPDPEGPDPASAWPDQPSPGLPRERGGWRRRRSAAATGVLIAGGAAVTGYLAYAVVAGTPAPNSATKASTTTGAQSPAATQTPPTKPSIQVPIATTGGSGTTTRHGDDGTGSDN